MRRLLLLLAVGPIIVGSLLASDSSVAYALDENNCLSCHGNPALTKADAEGKKISLYVSEEAVNTAAHHSPEKCPGSATAGSTL